MTEQNHPITLPPDKIHNLLQLEKIGWSIEQIITFVAQWGYDQAKADIERERQEAADQELEACCEWVSEYVPYLPESEDKLRAARRPKPPSLKEEALEQLDGIRAVFRMSHGGELVCDTIRRALESIPDPSD